MASYYLSDLFKTTFTFTNNVYAYDLPNFNSQKVAILKKGDSIQIYSYLNIDGRTWLMFHMNQVDYDNFNASYIATSGTPTNGNTIEASTLNSVGVIPTVQTVEQQIEKDATIFDQIGKVVTTILIGGAGLIALSKINASGNKK